MQAECRMIGIEISGVDDGRNLCLKQMECNVSDTLPIPCCLIVKENIGQNINSFIKSLITILCYSCNNTPNSYKAHIAFFC